MHRWSRKKTKQHPETWTVFYYGQPVGVINYTVGGIWGWECSTTGESGAVPIIEDAADLVRGCAILAKVKGK